MARTNVYLHALNQGVIDKDKLTRIDLQKLRLATEVQDNMIPDTSGKAFFRPGFEYLADSAVQTDGILLPFARSATSAEVIELTDSEMRVWSGNAAITRAAVTSSVTSGDFSASTGWTLTGTGGGAASISGGFLTLNSTSIGGRATARQQVSTSSPDVEHALRIVITRGPVYFRCGSSSGSDDYVKSTELRTGTHSLSFTPSGSYWVEFFSELTVNKIVDSVTVESSGIVVIPTPWAQSYLADIRTSQSIDVMFVACSGIRPCRIERRASGRSWSVVDYAPTDGPFTIGRTSPVKIKPSASYGNITLTSDNSFFTQEHVGALVRIFHSGTKYTIPISGDSSSSIPVRLSGISSSTYTSSDRYFTYTITGTWSGTLSMERSVDSETSGFHEYETRTANASYYLNDSYDNVVVWWRFTFRSGNYTSGYSNIYISYDGGGGYGIAKVTSVTNGTTASAEVVSPFYGTTYSADWRLGEFCLNQQWPSAVAMFDGRLFWFGSDRIWGSVSDSFESFDEDVEGDSAPISRSIATGGLNSVRWALGLQRLVMGTDGAEASARSSSLDEPLTSGNITIRDASTVGSSGVQAVRIDSRGIFVDRPGTTLFELLYDGSSNDYNSAKLSKLSSSLFTSGVKQLAIMRRPETRVFAVMNDGTVNLVVYEPQQEVAAFIPLKTRTGDLIKSIAIVPGTDQDRVYARVLRSLNGSSVYTVERMALDSETTPSTLCKCLDSFKTGTNAPASATISGLSHLNGETVYAWADGVPYGPFTVGSGSITMPVAVSQWVVGLRYRGRLKTARQAYAAQAGTPMLQPQRIDHVGLVMTNYHKDGVLYGTEFDNVDRPLDGLPAFTDTLAARPDIMLDDVTDEITFPIDGAWKLSPRVCVEVNSPYPLHLLGLVVTTTTSDRI